MLTAYAQSFRFRLHSSRCIAREINEMLNARSEEVGLKMNKGKMKAMQGAGMPWANLRVGGVDLEMANSYVYLHHKLIKYAPQSPSEVERF